MTTKTKERMRGSRAVQIVEAMRKERFQTEVEASKNEDGTFSLSITLIDTKKGLVGEVIGGDDLLCVKYDPMTSAAEVEYLNI